MADDLLAIRGAACLITHQISLDYGGPVTAATITIFDSAGTEVLAATAMTVVGGDGTNGFDADAYGLVYSWDTSGADPGDYRYLILPDAGEPIRGTLTLWPQWSELDRYIDAVRDILQETEVGELQRELSLRDYSRALAAAIQAYGQDVESAELSHTSDTVPAAVFSPFTLYAAGWAMAFPLANKAAHTNDPQVAAAVVSFRDIQSRRRQQGRDMMAKAQSQWTEDGVQTGTLTISDPSPFSQYLSDLEYLAG